MLNRAKDLGERVAAAKDSAMAKDLGGRVAAAKESANEKAIRIRERTSRMAKHGVRSAAERSIDWALNRTAATVRNSLVEEDAPKLLRHGAEMVFDAVWPELATEVKANVMLSVNESLRPYTPTWMEPRKVSGLRALRAHFLYAFQPFDVSGFRQLRWPTYWLITAWSACTTYGVQGLFWLTVFCLMDRSDEYTLVNFILSFKALMFITLGFAGLFIGSAQMQYCLTADISKVTCDTDGPGMQDGFFYQMGAFVLQNTLVWGAFLLLPCSTRAAGTQVDGVDHAAGKYLSNISNTEIRRFSI